MKLLIELLMSCDAQPPNQHSYSSNECITTTISTSDMIKCYQYCAILVIPF